MGLFAPLEPRPQLSYSDTPPELASPTSTNFSCRSSPAVDAVSAPRPLVSLPMAKAEGFANGDKLPEPRLRRVESNDSSAQRQQLPSLSSIFGPQSSMGPLVHPSSFRQEDNSASQVPAITQPRTAFDAQLEHDRQRSLSNPQSPGFPPIEASRSAEYSLQSREASNSPCSTLRSKFPGKPLGSAELERRQSVTSVSNLPLTPKSAKSPKSGDGPRIDIPGPKIWTGTQFLPRFVRAAEVPGEGLCYFYDDGTHCRNIIDGEAVNAHWGVTKAGKPRKRLAIACMTCREKKIKCDPDFPRCMQCEKFGRDCRFKNAPRGGQNPSPRMAPAELDLTSRKLAAVESLRITSNVGSPTTPNHFQTTPDVSFKRLRIGSNGYASAGEPSPMPDVLNHSKSPLLSYKTIDTHMPEDVLSRAWATDPYTTDPGAIKRVITQFFSHTDSCVLLRMLPEGPWTRWVSQSAGRKSEADLALLYSMLALSVVLVGDNKDIAADYAQVALFAQRKLRYTCLQLVQSRIIMSVYATALGNNEEASALLTHAIKDAFAMGLDMELDRSSEANLNVFPMGMRRSGYSEARRRTMWSLFILERLNGVFPDRPLALSPSDIHIRLPMDNQSFEQQADRWMPVLDARSTINPSSPDAAVDIPSTLVRIVYIWAECQGTVHTMASRPRDPATDEGLLRRLSHMVSDWHESLSNRLTFSSTNLESACFSGNATAVLAINLLYSQSVVKINRYHSGASRMPTTVQNRHSRECREHAWELMEMIRAYERLRHDRPSSYSMLPFVTIRACTEAIDVLTAAGSMPQMDDLFKLLRSARAVIENLCTVWDMARDARYAIERRLGQITHINSRRAQPTTPFDGYSIYKSRTENGEPVDNWAISEPLDNTYPKDTDLVYHGC